MKRKILVAALLALLLTLVDTSAFAACSETFEGPHGSTLTCNGTHTYTYNKLDATYHEVLTTHTSDEGGSKVTQSTEKHSFQEDYDRTLYPTCLADGYHLYVCTKCGYEKTVEWPTNGTYHSWKPNQTQPATCVSEGYHGSQCTVCGDWHIDVEVIPATGVHEPVEILGNKPTCCNDGWDKKICAVCYITIEEKSSIIPATGQHPGYNRVTVVEPTCSTTGTYEDRCTSSGNAISGGLLATVDHDYSVGPQKISEATCKHGLEYTYKCKWCSLTTVKTLSNPVNHEAAATYTVTKAATCTSTGEGTYYCKYGCGTVVKTETIPATGEHKYVEEEVKCGSTYDRGYTHKVCSVCKNEDTATGKYAVHTGIRYEDTKYQATCVSGGLGNSFCTTCGVHLAALVPTPINPDNHDRTNTIKDYVVEPTCCEQGAYNKLCGYGCGTTVAWNFKEPATGNHENTERKTTKDATCEEDGIYVIYCLDYNRAVDDGTIPALGHKVSNEYTSKTNYCTKVSEEVHECTREGCDYTETWYGVYYPGHVVQSKETKAATCLDKGEKTYYCANVEKGYVCEYVSNTEDIPALGHQSKALDDHIAATCTKQGRTEGYVCIRPGCAYYNLLIKGHDVIPETGHDMVPYYTEDSTCTKQGRIFEICNNGCGYTEAVGYADLKDHNYVSEVTKYPSCESTGEVVYTCSACDAEYREIIEKWKHVSHGCDNYHPATCTETGNKEEFRCIYCFELLMGGEEIPALGHDWGDWDVVKEATETEEGEKVRSCNRPYCDGTESETIPATGNGDDDDKPTPTPTPSTDPNHTPTPTPSADPNHTPTPTPSADPGDEPTPTSHPDDGPIGPFPTKNPYPIPTPVIDPDHEHEEQELKGFPPTCTEYGREDGTSCGICGETVTGGEWIAPTGHTPVVIPAVAPTETETGLTEGLKCGVCGEILRKQFIVDATGKYYDPENPDVPLDNPFAPGDIVDPSGKDVIGKVDPVGNVTDPSGKYVGTVDEEGNIIDENGNVIGKVDENGKVTDKDGNHVGDVFGYDELEGRLEPGHPNFNLSDYLDEYYSHVEGGDQIRPTIDEDKCIIGTKVKLDKDGITVLIKGAEDYAICPVDNYPMSQWIDLGNGMHKRICTCLDCDYYEIAACVYFIINVDDVEYKICPICGHFTERAYEWIKGVKVGGVGDMNELIARDITAPFGTDAVQVKDMSAEPTVITSSFTAVKSAKGVLSSWNDTETLYIPMVHPGDVTLVEMDFFGEFTALPFEYENGYVIFNADEHGLYLFVD